MTSKENTNYGTGIERRSASSHKNQSEEEVVDSFPDGRHAFGTFDQSYDCMVYPIVKYL